MKTAGALGSLLTSKALDPAIVVQVKSKHTLLVKHRTGKLRCSRMQLPMGASSEGNSASLKITPMFSIQQKRVQPMDRPHVKAGVVRTGGMTVLTGWRL